MADATEPTIPPAPLSRTLGWAAYLGVSWTWCIGMFLPILLMRDFGVWGFVVFAIPNVVGAAAMGWVIRAKSDVSTIWDRHRHAVRAFTLVTISFHLFFLSWLLWLLAPNAAAPRPQNLHTLLIVGVATALALIGVLILKRLERAAAVVVWVMSLALGGVALYHGALDELCTSPLLRLDAPPSLAFLAPVCIFGFLLCPYLDATFLRARHNLFTPRASRLAFGLGFGVFFFSMILLTIVYSAVLKPSIRPAAIGVLPVFAVAIFPHMLLQSFFTVSVHLRAMPGGFPRALSARLGLGSLWLALILLPFTIEMYALKLDGHAGLSLGEVIYRLFMSFYGLVFPAYVWICMIPTRDGHSGLLGPRGRRKLITLGAAVAAAAPFFWMGFIERQTWYLAPGLAIVLLARLAVRGPRRTEEKFARGGV